jgi:Ca2+-binding EF-hand superfamily protein
MDDVFGPVVAIDTIDARTTAFQAIDKDGSGLVSYVEWYKHFRGLLSTTNMTKDEFMMMFNVYDERGNVPGLDIDEYNNFMNEVFGEVK